MKHFELMMNMSNFDFLILESPRENNSKDSPASQADSGVFSIASSASPSKHDGVLNTDVRSPDSPGPSRVPALDNNAAQCKQKCIYKILLQFHEHYFSLNYN